MLLSNFFNTLVFINKFDKQVKIIPNKPPYFRIHENKDGYQVALQRALYGHYIVVLKDDVELGKFKAGDSDHLTVFELYKTIYRWLNYGPTDVEKKCKIMSEDKTMLNYRLQQLPQK